MLRPRDVPLAEHLKSSLRLYQQTRRILPGISDSQSCQVLVEQMVESVRRIKYVKVICQRQFSERRKDPNDIMFDPLKASVLFRRQEELDEAFWMVFLFVHFGKNTRGGWQFARLVYGKLGNSDRWNWENTSAEPTAFSRWLHDHGSQIKSQNTPGGFGNHRKYQSLDAYSEKGTGPAFETYVRWVGPPRTHLDMFEQALRRSHHNPMRAFDDLYESMSSVSSFGRTAKFDYLTMVGNLGLAPIKPGSPYLQEATGPLRGAKRLFGEHSPTAVNRWSIDLANELGVGMQVMEDALCNWQKSPREFNAFRG